MNKIKNGGVVMPGFDGTGPLGQGPLTGGGRGYCIVPLDSKSKVPLGYNGIKSYPTDFNYPKRIHQVIPKQRLDYSNSFKRSVGISQSNIRRGMGRKFIR